MILYPSELYSIIPKEEKGGSKVESYWRNWMVLLPLLSRPFDNSWLNVSKRLKKYYRDAESKGLNSIPTANNLMLRNTKELLENFGYNQDILQLNYIDSQRKKWTEVLPSPKNFSYDKFSLLQWKVAKRYENLHERISSDDVKITYKIFHIIGKHVPFAEDFIRRIEEDTSKQNTSESNSKNRNSAKIVRLLCTIDFLLHDPVIFSLHDNQKVEKFILDCLPDNDTEITKSKRPDVRYLCTLKNNLRGGQLSFIWKQLDPNTINKVNAWIRERQKPRQEDIILLIQKISNIYRGQIKVQPSLIECEGLTNAQIEEEAETMATLFFICHTKILDIMVLLDAIFIQMELLCESKECALELLHNQVTVSIRRVFRSADLISHN